jgi:hypothetical protein
MKKISTRAYRENFTENDVTSRHFVTAVGGCDHAFPARSETRPDPVTRLYRPETAVLEQLVEVLYSLLMDVPASPPATASAEPTCFSAAPE